MERVIPYNKKSYYYDLKVLVNKCTYSLYFCKQNEVTKSKSIIQYIINHHFANFLPDLCMHATSTFDMFRQRVFNL